MEGRHRDEGELDRARLVLGALRRATDAPAADEVLARREVAGVFVKTFRWGGYWFQSTHLRQARHINFTALGKASSETSVHVSSRTAKAWRQAVYQKLEAETPVDVADFLREVQIIR